MRIDTSDELCIQRWGNGIKLIKPDNNTHAEKHILNMMQLPFPVYFEDTDHIQIKSNEWTATACGFISLNDFIGKSPFKYFKRDTIVEKLANHKAVLNHQKYMITEEHALRQDGSDLHTLSVRMPWYSGDNKMIGIFGCSILLGQNPLAESLAQLSSLGLFQPIAQSGHFDLSKREIDCLRLTIKGKPAKQVGYELGISQRTVEEYLDNIKRKLKVTSKAALIEKAIGLDLSH